MQVGRQRAGVRLGLVCAAMFYCTPLAAQLSNSPHDLDSYLGTWDADRCGVCHLLNTGEAAPIAWMSQLPEGSRYTVYGSGRLRSPSLDAWIGEPDGSSLMCLSCHDGVSGSNVGHAPEGLGTDLSDDHPVSFVYDAALAARDGFLADPFTTQVTLEGADGSMRTGSIDQLMLEGGKLQCVSCHNVHGGNAASGRLKMSNDGSRLCTTCHLK